MQVIPRAAFDEDIRRDVFLRADQIIVGTNRTRSRINREMRSFRSVPETAMLPVEGEKLICTLNDWPKPLDEAGNFHLVNGIIGTCRNVREGEDGLALLDFRADFLPDTVYDLPVDAGIFTEGKYFHAYGAKACRLADGRLVHENNLEVCRFEFAYAVTCHKAQGSEYDNVVVIDESGCFENGKEWLYTAVTRARKNLILVR